MTLHESRTVGALAAASALTTTAAVGAGAGAAAAVATGMVALGAAFATIRLVVTKPRG